MALTKVDQTMVSDQVFGRKNLFLNGEMQVAQRGTSASQTTTGFETVDRWEFAINGAGAYTVSRDTDTPSGEGLQYSQKIQCTSADSSLAAGDYVIWRQKIEGINLQQLKYGTSSAEKLTLSFWVKHSNAGQTFIVEFFNDNSSENKTQSQSYTINSANTWEKKTITIDGDTAHSIQNTTNGELLVYFWLAAGSNYTGGGSLNTSWSAVDTVGNTVRAVGQFNLSNSSSNNFYITGVQLEEGDNATPFEHKPYSQEVIECRRYFERKQAIANVFLTVGQAFSTSGVYGTFDYQVEKRNTPSISISAEGSSGDVWSWLTVNGGGPTTVGTTIGHTITTWNTRLQSTDYAGLVDDSPSGFYSYGNAYIDIDAEL